MEAPSGSIENLENWLKRHFGWAEIDFNNVKAKSKDNYRNTLMAINAEKFKKELKNAIETTNDKYAKDIYKRRLDGFTRTKQFNK